jgi:hypothetical protein
MLTSPLDLALDMGPAQFAGQPASEEQAEHAKNRSTATKSDG